MGSIDIYDDYYILKRYMMDTYDILHINTVGMTSLPLIIKTHMDNKPVIYHAHSTEEDFKNSIILSNQIIMLNYHL